MTRILAALLVLAVSGVALACGGPATAVVDGELAPLADVLREVVMPSDGLDWNLRGEFRFLYPFGLAKGAALDDLFHETYGLVWSDGGLVRDDRSYCFETAGGGRSCTSVDWPAELKSNVVRVTSCSKDGKTCREIVPEPRRLAPLVAAFDAAGAAHDWPAARRAAERTVAQVIDMPGARAATHAAEFNRAVEFLELFRTIPAAGDDVAAEFFARSGMWDPNQLPAAFREADRIRDRGREAAAELLAEDPNGPRAGTLRFVLLQDMLKRDIPNGWSDAIREQPLGATWARLGAAIHSWLADFPGHPLRDLVRLLRVRLLFFSGGDHDGFGILREMYPRHLERVLAEMRYLAFHMSATRITSLVDIEHDDPVLVTSLVGLGGAAWVPSAASVDPVDWSVLWQRAAANRGAAWARNLQERLLALAAERAAPNSLPEEFPATPENPTPLWGKLRLLALVKAERWDAAREQASALAPDAVVANLTARVQLATGSAWRAAMVEGLPDAERRYLVRVLLDDADLAELVHAAGTPLRQEAAIALGVRRAAAGDWNAAVDVADPVDPERAALWRQCGVLAADDTPAGLLRWARFLAAHRGRIWYPRDRPWDRGVEWRAVRLRGDGELGATPIRHEWTPEYERAAIERALVRDEALLTMRTFVRFLSAAPGSPDAPAAVREADRAYNELVNYEPLANFWQVKLGADPSVARLRGAGRRTR